MTLPALLLQNVYGKLAWAIVIAAVIASLLSASRQLTRREVGQLIGIAFAVALLPEQFSPVYWIALAFQWPSGMLVALCLLYLSRPWRLAPAGSSMPLPLAAAIAVFGTVLYLDALGLASLGLYFWGFGPRGAPLFALSAMALCLIGIVQGYARPHLFAALGAFALFTLLRLPTGNLWDALLDPLLWVWALQSLATTGWRVWERKTEINKIKQGVVSGKS
ncbi:MAG: hypothetical protein K0R43_3470 [Pseudoduganella sp.]|jgi:hypothetical protein|nr:hypothetical protein [Pseudoduganella sp.]